MRDQITEITGQIPFISSIERCERQGIIPNMQGSYWMEVYSPLIYMKPVMPAIIQLCPWDMIAEITDDTTPYDRKQQVLDALRNGQHMMSFYDIPSDKILFMEDNMSGKITVWVN